MFVFFFGMSVTLNIICAALGYYIYKQHKYKTYLNDKIDNEFWGR